MTTRSTSFLRAGSQFDVKSMARAIHSSLQSPNSGRLLDAVESGNWEAVLALRAEPANYTSAIDYLKDVIPTMFKKCTDLPLTVDRLEATLKLWWKAEHDCYRSNQRLFQYSKGFIQMTPADAEVYRHIDGIRKIVASWIGQGPSQPELGFSPGSTLTDRGYTSTVAHKMSKDPSSTIEYDSAGYPGFIGTLWHHNMVDANRTPLIARGGEFFTVPKTALVERCAELQPSLNMSAQLGAGKDLRRRFKKASGWDLTRAQDIHREVARKASVSKSFATIDLSSASDTVGKVLVELLLPLQWFVHLDGLRTHYIKGVIPGRSEQHVLLEKFSSMGNGFTFELETIIFAAIACYVSRINGYYGELGFDVFVYGDDIIIRDELYSDVKAVLEFCGFSVNTAKSFFGSSPFRESCGGDFFEGRDVRPIFPEKLNDLTVQEQLSVVNQVNRASRRLKDVDHNLGLNRLWFDLLGTLPRWVRDCRGPERFGDSVVHDANASLWVIKSHYRLEDIVDSSFNYRGKMKVPTEYIKSVGFHPGIDAWIPWSRFDPATVLACAVLGYGKGDEGLLPRKPVLVPEPCWVVFGCPSTEMG